MQANTKQQEAIDKINWPLLIIAWAWSWKTATLTKRVENMISNKKIEPSSILMVTFTNKAAMEMKQRVAKTMWVEVPRSLFYSRNFPSIWTFHSIWIYFLKTVLDPRNNISLNSVKDIDKYKDYSSEIKETLWLKKDFVIYDETDKISILKSIIKTELNLDEKEFSAKQISFYISKAKSELINSKLYGEEANSYLKQIVFEVYSKYEKKLKANNALDFDDILIKTLELLKIPPILEYFQEKYKYIMVDEYQDTNKPQYEIIKLLSSKYFNLAVVWDDSQSIYSWRGANLQNILDFKKDYKNALIIKLEQNYRSTKNILNWANSVIKNNKNWMKKELWTENDSWEKINLIEAVNDKNEAKAISQIIKERTNKEEYPESKYWDNLILYRTNSQSRQIEEALLSSNIPYKIIWGLKFYDRKEIKDLIAYLKIIFNPQDNISVKRIINTPARKIWSKTIETLDKYCDNFWLSYTEIFGNIEEVDDLKPSSKKSIFDLYDNIKNLIKKSFELEVEEIIKEVINSINYEKYITEGLNEEEKQSKLDNIQELINLASQYKWFGPRESLDQFLEEISLLTDLDRSSQKNEKLEDEKDYVVLMTIHTSKWLEQKRVFIAWLEDGIFPSFRSINDNNSLEEERRLMYVAMTRAKEELYLTRAKERFYFGSYVRNLESRFIWEIEPSLLEEYNLLDSYILEDPIFSINYEEQPLKTDRNSKIVRKIADNDISNFSKWDKIYHPKFGNGIIVMLDWETAEIAFSWTWIKKMNIRIAPIKKVEDQE